MPESMLMMVIERVGTRVVIDQAEGRLSGRVDEVGAQDKLVSYTNMFDIGFAESRGIQEVMYSVEK